MSTRYEPAHTLSKKAVANGWNVFVWSNGYSPIRIGFSLHERSHITLLTLHRWIKMLNYRLDVKFALVPVEVLPMYCEIFRYQTNPSGPVLCATSTELLQPGDYSMIRVGTEKFYFAGGEKGGGSYRDMQSEFPERYQQEADQCLQVDEEVINRDGHCLLTGIPAADCAVTSVWIMPPSAGNKKQTLGWVWENDMPHTSDLRFRLTFSDDDWDDVLQNITAKDIDISLCRKSRVNCTMPVQGEMAEYMSDPDPRDWSQTARNYITVRKDLADLLMENKITIDPDDNYRIVIPHLSDEIRGIPLLTHLKLDHINDPSLWPKDRFFRGHLFKTLASNSFGGDISLDYPHDYTEYMEDLGVYDGTADPNDPEWQTQLGKEIWAMMMRMKLEG